VYPTSAARDCAHGHNQACLFVFHLVGDVSVRPGSGFSVHGSGFRALMFLRLAATKTRIKTRDGGSRSSITHVTSVTQVVMFRDDFAGTGFPHWTLRDRGRGMQVFEVGPSLDS
jgi:hypothetical protein